MVEGNDLELLCELICKEYSNIYCFVLHDINIDISAGLISYQDRMKDVLCYFISLMRFAKI